MASAGFDDDQALGQGFLELHSALGYEPDDDVAEGSVDDVTEGSDDDSVEESDDESVEESDDDSVEESDDDSVEESDDDLVEESDDVSDVDSIEYLSGSDREKAEEYDRQIEASQGYDLDKPYVWRDMVGGFVPVDLNVAGLATDGAFESVEFAIRKENEKRKNPEDHLKLVGLLKATAKCCHTVYYSTFVAKCSKKEDAGIYQCQVWYKFYNEEESEVMEFREKPDTLMSYVNDWKEILVEKRCGQKPSAMDQTGYESGGLC